MRQVLVSILIGAFIFSPMAAWGQQDSGVPVSSDSRHEAGQNDKRIGPQACGELVDTLRAARLVVDQDRKALSGTTDSGRTPAINHDESSPGKLAHDLNVADQKEMDFEQCAALNTQPGAMPDPSNACLSEPLLNFQMSHHGDIEREIPIRHLLGSPVFFYEAGMTIDADGAPNAYHPDNTGLDDLTNAGSPGYWEGLAKDRDGEPFVQGPDDPYPGYYVSATALADRSKPANDPTRYVDATKVPFIVLPGWMARQYGARPGDFAAVMNLRNGKSSYAIFGDVGPSDRIGEGSIALAENLGVRSDARNGGARGGIVYLVFPGSGNGQPRSVDEINIESERLLRDWGGTSQLSACTVQQTSGSLDGTRSTN